MNDKEIRDLKIEYLQAVSNADKERAAELKSLIAYHTVVYCNIGADGEPQVCEKGEHLFALSPAIIDRLEREAAENELLTPKNTDV